jgi:peptide/nickel transport system substrate-binding protein
VIPVTIALAAALLVAASGSPSGAKDGGTFRVSITNGLFGPIDPALSGRGGRLLRPACAALMSFPDKPLPAGLRLMPELAVSDPVVSSDGRRYTFTIRKDARFSDGAAVTANAFAHALERILDPAMKSGLADEFTDIVGAADVVAGRASTARGIAARGRTLTLALTKRVPDFTTRLSYVCAVPETLPSDPEGAKAPLPSPAPYFVSEYVPGERVTMEQNPFYRGTRPHHFDRITIDLRGQASAIDDVESGKLDFAVPTPDLSGHLAALVKRYGENRSRVFVQPDLGGRMVLINTSRPLFRNNVKLRQALNFAVDRAALVRVYGGYAATPTDQYLPSAMPGFRDARIYPLRADVAKARSLASGRTRSGKAVLYTCSDSNRPDCAAVAAILRKELEAIGLQVQVKSFPLQIEFQKLATRAEPFDLAWIGWGTDFPDPDFLDIFDGRTIGRPDNQNWSYFNSAKYNRLFAEASRLTGAKRYQAYGALDVQLARDAAPAIAVMNTNTWAFVSKRIGCVVMNPDLDLTAVCLK